MTTLMMSQIDAFASTRALAPYSARRLGKNGLTAHQVSPRGGELECRVAADRVHLGGRCVTCLEGSIRV